MKRLSEWFGRQLCAHGWHDDVASIPERSMVEREGLGLQPATTYMVICMRCPNALHVTHYDAPGRQADFERTRQVGA